MTLTAKDVAEIMRLLEQSSFDSLSLEIDGVKLNLQRASPLPPREVPPSATRTEPKPPPITSGPPKPKPPSEPGLHEITCPLLGIFYRAPKPGELPFIDVESKVNEDTVVGIVEVMKLMNSVHAGVNGTVVEILAENGALVEFGEILMRVRPGS
jgi:acetyl-CoA carboxylase biotin carboxyl carrier protein